MISVAMAVYNGEKYIVEQLDSIRNQTREVDEVIVCDDCSSDSTVEIINNYRKQYPSFPILFFQNEKNLGYKLNFKEAMSKTSGDYIFLCDQDDVWFEDKVEQMVTKMKSNPKILVLASSFVYLDDTGRKYMVKQKRGMSNNNLYIRPVKIDGCVPVNFDLFLTRNFFQGSALCITKRIKDEVVNHFSDKIHHDWFINITASKYEGMYFWNKPFYAYRIHESNAVGIQGEYESKTDHIQKANSLDVRTQLPKEGLKCLQALQESDPVYYSKNIVRLDSLKQFYLEHIHALETNDTKAILMENRNSEYGLMKTKKARLMDVVFTLKGKLKRS